jgi:hypothetical protein
MLQASKSLLRTVLPTQFPKSVLFAANELRSSACNSLGLAILLGSSSTFLQLCRTSRQPFFLPTWQYPKASANILQCCVWPRCNEARVSTRRGTGRRESGNNSSKGSAEARSAAAGKKRNMRADLNEHFESERIQNWASQRAPRAREASMRICSTDATAGRRWPRPRI